MIGIFDSGVGGLSIYAKIRELLPNARFVYLADSANFPYGEKSEEELFAICDKNIELLAAEGAKIIVIACNSATVSTIGKLREKWEIPIVGIEPALKVAANRTKNGRIGLIGTKSTIKNHNSKELVGLDQTVVKVHHGELVERVETDYQSIDDEYLKRAIGEFTRQKVDTIVLGCTHYFFLKNRLEVLFPEIIFLAPDEAVAKRTKSVAEEKHIDLSKGTDSFLVSGDAERFAKTFEIIFGKEPKKICKVKNTSQKK